ncbi:MAG: GDP-fucose synthetase [Rhodospirillaceae bacterium]|nr:GDP-fucose synthetase [Rhodospirillaceae bacterium]
MEQDAKIYVAGHRGLVGQALVRQLRAQGHENIVTRTSLELDLTEQADVRDFFEAEKPDYVLDAAAIVGGILANHQYPADFIAGNLKIQTNLIETAYRAGAKKMLFLGSTCIMPRDAPQPIKEDYILTGPLEETNQWYAVAKIAGIKMCQAYRRQYGFDAISVQPTNLFGIGDNFDYETSHMAPAMIRRMHEAKQSGAQSVLIWGTGTPRREIMFADDMADACVYLMNKYSGEDFVNIGTGEDISITDFATMVADVVGYDGSFEYDTSRPDGTPRKLVDVTRLTDLGWQSKISLREGVERTYAWYIENEGELRTLSAENLSH